MTGNRYYMPADQTLWAGRPDTPPGACFFQLMQVIDLRSQKLPPVKKNIKSFALIGFCSDEGVRRNLGRIGAKEGPDVIRQALARLPVQKQSFQCFDVGNIICDDQNLSEQQKALAEVVATVLAQGAIPIVLGGGHEIAWGHYQGIAAAFPQKNLGIINFDAHLDLRPLLKSEEGSSGTPFLQIAEAHHTNHRRFDYNCIGIQHAGNIHALFEVAKKYGVKIIWADELQQGQLEKCVDFIDRTIDQNEMVYLSVCLDVFAAAFAPGVSAPQPLGLLPWQVIPLIRQLAASGKVIAYDVAEMSPKHDIDRSTAKLAANLIYEFIHHHNEHPRPW